MLDKINEVRRNMKLKDELLIQPPKIQENESQLLE